MVIEPISNHVHVIPTLVEWYQSEWKPYYGKDGPGDARADLVSRCNRDRLPLGLVALEDDQTLGTTALDLDVTTHLTPSVVGLLVAPPYRRQGVATALLMASEEIARRLGHRQLYASTAVLGGLLGKLGWEKMGEAKFLDDITGSVYVRNL